MWICQVRVTVWKVTGTAERMPGEDGKAGMYSEWRREVDRTYDEVLEELFSGCTTLNDIYLRLPSLMSIKHEEARELMQMVAQFPTPNEKSELYHRIFSFFRRRLRSLSQKSISQAKVEQEQRRIHDLFNILILGLAPEVGWSCNMLPFHDRLGKLMKYLQAELQTCKELRQKAR